MKIVVAPDKFKGSLPATQAAAAIAAGLRSGLRPAGACPEVITVPVADGGERTVDAAVAAGFERVPVTAAGPAGDLVRASYARRRRGRAAAGARRAGTRQPRRIRRARRRGAA